MGNVPGKEQQVRNARSISEDYNRDGQVRSKRPSAPREKKREPRVFVDPNEQVDGGYLVPQGVYTGPQDFDILVVKSLMTSRKLAPFFKGLQDYEEDWTDHQLMAAIRGFPIPSATSESTASESADTKDASTASTSSPHAISTPSHLLPPTAPPQVAISPPRHTLSSNNPFRDPLEHLSHLRIDLDNTTLSQSAPTPSWMRSGEPDQEDGDELINPGILQSPPSREVPSPPTSRQRAKTVTAKEPPLMVKIYRDPIECPICFLYYPNSLNMTRCCAQPICSECFVQMKRAEPHPRHDEPEPDTLLGQLDLISEPTTCPYCAMTDFGVVYSPRHGPGAKAAGANGADAAAAKTDGDESAIDDSADSTDAIDTTNMDDVAEKLMHMSGAKRRSSISVTNPNVVTVDRVRPDWSKTLAAARARAARKAATANALHATAFVEGGNGEVAGSSRSSRRTRQNHEQRQAARAQELEQIMLSEAMRLSMLESQEAEEKRAKEKEEKEKGGK
ncbi:Protein SIP5 [Yarrowia sp. C11]|nr:Protein SIP5 [Yarrowia sp. E02]KAG5372812.1 Protein SIP5 [Yarrowia sp. C11]